MIEVWHLDTLTLRDAGFDRDVIFALTRPESEDEQADAAVRLFGHGLYVKVAEIATDDLETAWYFTNNIDTSWSMEPKAGVEVTAPLHHVPAQAGDLSTEVRGEVYGLRSSMVGDIFVKRHDSGGEAHIVAMCGFHALGPIAFTDAGKPYIQRQQVVLQPDLRIPGQCRIASN